jgi:hypothetical protein
MAKNRWETQHLPWFGRVSGGEKTPVKPPFNGQRSDTIPTSCGDKTFLEKSSSEVIHNGKLAKTGRKSGQKESCSQREKRPEKMLDATKRSRNKTEPIRRRTIYAK